MPQCNSNAGTDSEEREKAEKVLITVAFVKIYRALTL
jgi:hypothetical protein